MECRERVPARVLTVSCTELNFEGWAIPERDKGEVRPAVGLGEAACVQVRSDMVDASHDKNGCSDSVKPRET